MSAQCSETVYVPEQPRYSGRGPSGFSMHFTERRCERAATYGEKCWQHDKERSRIASDKAWEAKKARRRIRR